MNRISTLTLGSIFAVCALGVACASGGDDDGDKNNATAGSGTNGGSNSGMAGSPSTGGTQIPIGGASNPTAGASSTAGTPSTAGSGGSTPGGPSVCDTGTRALPLAEAFIDNVEAETRWGNWYIFSDTTPKDASPVERATSGAVETGFSAHEAVTGILPPTKKGYGAGIGFNLVNTSGGETCLDVSAFDGISFWAKGTSGTANVVKFQAVAPATQPTDALPKGDCVPMTACAFIHPAKSITLTAEWKQYVIPFTELVSAAAPFAGKILQWNIITPDEAWDISIDEVTFYKGTAPTGAIELPVEGGGGSGGSGGGGNGGSGGTN